MAATLVVYGVLVATHLGEFWPFSIYPMFSQAGKPWSRSIVRDLSDETPRDGTLWTSVGSETLPGKPVSLKQRGVDPIDLANFVSKTASWDENRVEGLRTMFRADQLGSEKLMVFRARGSMNTEEAVVLSFEPYVLLHRQGAEINPRLPR